MDAAPTDIAEFERQLDALQQESQVRRGELQELAAALPVATSRRALVKSMAASIVYAPNKPLVAKRVVLKILRQPTELIRRIRAR